MIKLQNVILINLVRLKAEHDGEKHDGEECDIVVERSRLLRMLEKDLSLDAGDLRPWRNEICEQAMALGPSLDMEIVPYTWGT